MERLMEDLRFFIGVFFMIIGLMLLLEAFTNPSEMAGYNLNLLAGSVFLVFGALPTWFAIKGCCKSSGNR